MLAPDDIGFLYSALIALCISFKASWFSVKHDLLPFFSKLTMPASFKTERCCEMVDCDCEKHSHILAQQQLSSDFSSWTIRSLTGWPSALSASAIFSVASQPQDFDLSDFIKFIYRHLPIKSNGKTIVFLAQSLEFSKLALDKFYEDP